MMILPIADCQLLIADCGLRIADFQSPLRDCFSQDIATS
jgi:hypothetical protein